MAVSDALLAFAFAFAALVSIGASWLLVSALERVGARVGLSEALLGMLAALAADAPEITAATTALLRHDERIGAGVVIGSNVFNLAALIGLAGVVAGYVALHPRVVELAGSVATWIAVVALVVILGATSPIGGLVLVLVVFVPYLVLLGIAHERIGALPIPSMWRRWLLAAVTEEEAELSAAINPRRGSGRDTLIALGAVAVVVGASIEMERWGSELGQRHGVPPIVIGALLLAAVTSLPNAVAAVYLATRGRAAAVLSTALNSNAINIIAGLLIPTAFLGISAPSAETTFIGAAYLGMTLLALLCTYRRRGLGRREGSVIIAAYLAFCVALLAIAY